MDWKDFFYFSRRERQGILFLIVLIAGIFLGKWFFTPEPSHVTEEPGKGEEALIRVNPPSEKTEQPAYTPLYRDRSPANRTSYPRQPKQEETRTYYAREKETTPNPVSSTYPKTEKLTEGTVIELNAADSLELMRIPGIGSSFARRIVSYRNILGGYHRIEQLQEVYGMYEELYAKITPYLRIDTQGIRLIPVNSASLDQLKAHPYLNFYQAKVLVDMRKKKGKLTGIEDLQLLEEFSPDDWIRLGPYLVF